MSRPLDVACSPCQACIRLGATLLIWHTNRQHSRGSRLCPILDGVSAGFKRPIDAPASGGVDLNREELFEELMYRLQTSMASPRCSSTGAPVGRFDGVLTT